MGGWGWGGAGKDRGWMESEGLQEVLGSRKCYSIVDY